MIYNIWSEGAIFNGGGCRAQFWGQIEANSFKEAVQKLAEKNPGFALHLNKDCTSYWGCELFDNEADARKFAG
jgi:hypothetical protein